jgi:hypothetical protein
MIKDTPREGVWVLRQSRRYSVYANELKIAVLFSLISMINLNIKKYFCQEILLDEINLFITNVVNRLFFLA